MGVDPISLAVLAVTTVSSVGSYSEQKKASKAQQQANQIQQQQADLQSAIQRREAVKQARIARAQSLSVAENQGATLTSSAQGAVGSVTSQLNANLSFLDQYNTLSDMASKKLGDAAKYMQNARTYEAIGSLAQQGASFAGQQKAKAPKTTGAG